MRIQALWLILALSLTSPFSANAEEGTWLKQTIYGMDCTPCAHAMETNLGRLNGVNAVEVSLNDGLATLTLGPDAEPDVGEIRAIVERGGFTPQATELRLRGRITATEDETVLMVGEQRFILAPTESIPADRIVALDGETVLVTGRITEADTDRLRVNAIQWDG